MEGRDLTDIRLIGTFAFALGVVLLLLTILLGFLSLLAGGVGHTNLLKGALAALVALIMALALIGCGGTMRAIRATVAADLENLRLVWTALVLVMVTTGAASIWLLPPLTDVAVLVLLGLLAIRGAVIRLTSR